MDFDYTEDQKLLRDMVRQFGRDSVEPGLAEMDDKEETPEAILKEMADLGLFGLAAPESFGGSQVSLLTQVMVAEELGRTSAALAVTTLHHGFLLPALLSACGSEEQKSRYLPDICSGRTLGTLAVGEVSLVRHPESAADPDPAGSEITAAPDAAGWKLNGRADWVVSGNSAGIGAFFARTKDDLEAFLVPLGAEGPKSEKITGKLGLRSAEFARLGFDGLTVDIESRLDGGQASGGENIRTGVRLLSDLFLAAVGVGHIQSCIEVSREYAKERKQFGKPIGSFQLVQELIARMVFDVEAARLLVYRAAFEAEGQGLNLEGCREAIARARSFTAGAGLKAGTETVQVHGGYGFSSEFPAERLFRDARTLAVLSGGTGELLRISAEGVLQGS